MESNIDIFHSVLIFNNQNEPILNIYDEYFYNLVIMPSKARFGNDVEQTSIKNVLMQLFSPIIASQNAMMDTLKTKFSAIDLFNGQTLILHSINNCSMIILLSEKCSFRQHTSIISKKLDLIDWIICSFYGVCWSQMKFNSERWLKILLQEMWLMDNTEFNLMYTGIERIDLNSKLKLNERVLEVLVNNSRYFRQVNEKKIKHQLIFVGSKLFSLHTSNEASSNFKAKDNLLFVIISNALFNRFSRAREPHIQENNLISDKDLTKNLIRSISKDHTANETPASSSSSTDEFFIPELSDPEITSTVGKLSDSIKTNSITSTCSSVRELDPFVLWIDNKDEYKYRIVRIFHGTSSGLLIPCHVHLIKLARNVIYIGVEEDLESNNQLPTLEKSIRFLRKIIFDYDKKSDVLSVIKTVIGQSIDKLHYMGTIYGSQLREKFRTVLLRNSTSSDLFERAIKELLKIFELIYCQYYIASPIKVNEKLCKSFMRCYSLVRKEMEDFLSILSIKAIRNLSPTSFYVLYPGLVHFIVKTRKLHNSLICPVVDQDYLSDYKIQRVHLLADLCQKIGTQMELSGTWRHIEICDRYFRCTYVKQKYKILEDKYHEFELTVFHLSEVSVSLVKKQIGLLMNQFLPDQRATDTTLLDLMS